MGAPAGAGEPVVPASALLGTDVSTDKPSNLGNGPAGHNLASFLVAHEIQDAIRTHVAVPTPPSVGYRPAHVQSSA